MTTTVYSGRVTNWPLIWLANGLAVVLVLMSGLPNIDPVGLLIVAAALIVTNLTMTSVRTTAGPNGVVVRYGVLGIPRFRYAAADIADAEAIDLPFRQVGGWGIHWSPWRGTRLTIRSGPTLQLRMTSGKRVAVSAVDPQAAVDVISHLDKTHLDKTHLDKTHLDKTHLDKTHLDKTHLDETGKRPLAQ